MSDFQHCIACGYSREGLARDGVCPECGETVKAMERKRAECIDLAQSMRRLMWRFMLLRPLPAGWWEAFRDERDVHWSRRKTITVLAVAAAVLFGIVLFDASFWISRTREVRFVHPQDPLDRTITAHTEGDFVNLFSGGFGGWEHLVATPPAGAVVEEVTFWSITPIAPDFANVVVSLWIAVLPIFMYVSLRFVWLNLALRMAHLPRSDRSAARLASRPLAAANLAQVILLPAVGLLKSIWIVLFGGDSGAAFVLMLLLLCIYIGYPFAVWGRAMAADVGRRIFTPRWGATLLLFGLTFVTAVVALVVLLLIEG